MRNYKVLLVGLIFSLLTANAFTQTNTFPSSGSVGIGTTAPTQKLHVDGSTLLNYPGRYYITNSNVTSEIFLATNGQGSGWMINGTYSGSGNPQGNSTYSIAPGQHNTSAGYLDFDGNSKNWSFNLSATSTGIGNPISWQRVAFFDNSEIELSPTGNGSDFHIESGGNIGVGTDSPDSKLHVFSGSSGGNPHSYSKATIEHSDNAMFSVLTPNDKIGYYGFGDNNDDFVGGIQYNHSNNSMNFRVNNHNTSNSDITIIGNGNVGIGTITPDEKLAVNGTIRSKEVIVEATNWPDYVFEEEYSLPTLSEIEAFIKANKHLPEVPSAKEMEENGILLGAMNTLLLKKIEELTLHTISQEKKIQLLIETNKKLISRIENIEQNDK